VLPFLGSLDGVFCDGEIRHLWERGLRDDRLCGCGVSFRTCPVWRSVLAEAAITGPLQYLADTPETVESAR